MLPPQVTARRVGPPPTAVSTVKQPPSPMQVDIQPPKRIPPVPLSYRAKDYLQFLGKGNRQGKVFAVSGDRAQIVVQYNRPNGKLPHFVKFVNTPGEAMYLRRLTASTMSGSMGSSIRNLRRTVSQPSQKLSALRQEAHPKIHRQESILQSLPNGVTTKRSDLLSVTNQRRPLN